MIILAARTLAASSDHPKTDAPYLGRPADPQTLLPLIPGHYESGLKWFELVFDPTPESLNLDKQLFLGGLGCS